MKVEFSRQFLEKYSNIKFNENPSKGSRVVPCRRTDGQRNTTNLIVAFRNFAKAPNTFQISFSHRTATMTGRRNQMCHVCLIAGLHRTICKCEVFSLQFHVAMIHTHTHTHVCSYSLLLESLPVIIKNTQRGL